MAAKSTLTTKISSIGKCVDYLPVGLAFVMPISRMLSAIVIGIWFIAIFITGKVEINKKRVMLLLPSILWIIQLVSGLFDSNDILNIRLDSKASLIILPVILFLNGRYISSKILNWIFNGLVLGTAIALLHGFFPALFLTMKSDNFTFIVYRYYAGQNVHHTYIALYFCLSFFLYLYKDQLGFRPLIKSKWLLFLFLLIFISFFSRAGIIMVFVILVSRFCAPKKGIYISNYLLMGIISSFIIIGLLSGGKILNHNFLDLFSNIDIRITLWRIMFSEALNNLLLGVGVGNVKSIIYQGLINMDMPEFAQIHYNAHNQFIQYLMELGLVGLCLYIFVLFIPFTNKTIRENQFFIIFVFIVIVGSSFESILERQFGAMFLGYYYSLFVLISQNQEKYNHTNLSMITVDNN